MRCAGPARHSGHDAILISMLVQYSMERMAIEVLASGLDTLDGAATETPHRPPGPSAGKLDLCRRGQNGMEDRRRVGDRPGEGRR